MWAAHSPTSKYSAHLQGQSEQWVTLIPHFIMIILLSVGPGKTPKSRRDFFVRNQAGDHIMRPMIIPDLISLTVLHTEWLQPLLDLVSKDTPFKSHLAGSASLVVFLLLSMKISCQARKQHFLSIPKHFLLLDCRPNTDHRKITLFIQIKNPMKNDFNKAVTAISQTHSTSNTGICSCFLLHKQQHYSCCEKE